MASTRFRAVRKKLDQLGYKLPLSMESTCLVEKLINELEKLKSYRLQETSTPKGCIGNRLDTFTTQIKQLTTENNQLHQNLIKQSESNDVLTQELRNKLRKLEHDNTDLRFVNSQYMYKLKELEKENYCQNERILQLQENDAQAIIQTRGQCAKRRDYAFRRQKMDITNSLPSSSTAEAPAYVHVDEPYVADMLEVADKRITQLRRELVDIQTVVEDLRFSNSSLQQQLVTRDNEIERLNQHLTRNEAITSCVDEMMSKSSNEKELECYKDKISKLEDEIEDLGLQLCNALKQKEIAENSLGQLNNRNKKLEQELHQLKNITDRIQEDKEKIIKTSANEIGQTAGKLKKSLRDLDNLHNDLCIKRKENSALACDKEKLEGIIQAREEEIYSLENEKLCLNDKLSQLTSIKTQLESEVSALKQTLNTSMDCSCKCKCGKKPYFTRFEDNLNEIQRTYGKAGCSNRNDFTRFATDIHPQPPVIREHKAPVQKCRHKVNIPTSAKLSPPRVAFGRRAITPPPDLRNARSKNVRFSRSPSPIQERIHQAVCQREVVTKNDTGMKETQGASQIKALAEERDYYQSCYEALRNRGEGVASPPTRDVKLESVLAGNVKGLIKERDELKNRLGKVEEQNTELQSCLKELRLEKDQIQKQFRDTEKERRRLEQEVTVGKSAAERSASRRLERENEVVSQDLHTVILDRDTLRDKLKLATETQIQERRRLEKQISCLQNKIREKENYFTDTCAQSNAYKSQMTHLEEQLQFRDRELAEAKDELAQQRFSIAELKKNIEKFQNCLDETEHRLRLKEASGIEKYAKDMEDEIMKLRVMHREYTCETDGLRRTVAAIDREKDQLQMEVDERTERIALLEEKLKRAERCANDLKITCNTLEVNLDRQRDDVSNRDKEIRSLRRELELFEKEIQQLTYSQNNLAARSYTMQDDLGTMTQEIQRLHADLDACTTEKQELKLQIQNYIDEVSKFEELLREKDQERMDILDQFQTVTVEANCLETQNNQLESESATFRVELHAKHVEVQHLQTVLGGLQQEIEQYISSQQTKELEISQLKRTIASLESECERSKQDKENIQDDLNTVRSLYTQVEHDKEGVVDQLTKKETECDRLQQELADIQSQLDGVQGEAQQQRIKIIELESLLSNNRRKEFENQLSYKDMSTDLRLAQEQLSDCEQRLVHSNRETLHLRSSLAEMKVEAERLERQLTNEKFERERACQELRKLQAVSRTRLDDSELTRSSERVSSYDIELYRSRLRSGLEAVAGTSSKPDIAYHNESVIKSDESKNDSLRRSTERRNSYSWRHSLSWDKSHSQNSLDNSLQSHKDKTAATPVIVNNNNTTRPKLSNFQLKSSFNYKNDEENLSLTRATNEQSHRHHSNSSNVPIITDQTDKFAN